MQQVNVYIETDSTSPRAAKRKYGYVLECMARGQTVTREGFGEVNGTYNAATLEGLKEALGRIREPCEIHIHTENGYVLNMVDNCLRKWQESGFVNGKGKPVANKEEWEIIGNLLKKQIVKTKHGTHIYARWLKREMKARKN